MTKGKVCGTSQEFAYNIMNLNQKVHLLYVQEILTFRDVKCWQLIYCTVHCDVIILNYHFAIAVSIALCYSTSFLICT